MRTILKYKLPLQGNQCGWFELELPAYAEILSVAMRGDEAYLWAKIWDDAPMCKRKFFLCGTGHALEGFNSSRFIGTYQTPVYVWHLFEVLPN